MADDHPMREMDLAFLTMFELILDVLTRIGVPWQEFESQFQRSIKDVNDYPQAKLLMEGLKRVAKRRADELGEVTRLQTDPPQGSA